MSACTVGSYNSFHISDVVLQRYCFMCIAFFCHLYITFLFLVFPIIFMVFYYCEMCKRHNLMSDLIIYTCSLASL